MNVFIKSGPFLKLFENLDEQMDKIKYLTSFALPSKSGILLFILHSNFTLPSITEEEQEEQPL